MPAPRVFLPLPGECWLRRNALTCPDSTLFVETSPLIVCRGRLTSEIQGAPRASTRATDTRPSPGVRDTSFCTGVRDARPCPCFLLWCWASELRFLCSQHSPTKPSPYCLFFFFNTPKDRRLCFCSSTPSPHWSDSQTHQCSTFFAILGQVCV